LGLSLALSATLIELALGWQAERSQSGVPDYGDVVDAHLHPGGFLKPGFDGRVTDGLGGQVQWTTNAQGFRRSQAIAAKPAAGVLRVLVVGDSFAAGYRVDQEASAFHLLERRSLQELGPTEVPVAMTHAPKRALDWLREYGLGWSPHLVLLGITLGNDMAESYVSLHPEPIAFGRELRDVLLPGTAVDPPRGAARAWWRLRLWLSDRHLVRAIIRPAAPVALWYSNPRKLRALDPASGLGMYLRDPIPEVELAFQRMFRILREIRALLGRHEVHFAVMVFPQRFEVQLEDWRATLRDYRLVESAFDLDAPRTRLMDFAAEEGIAVIDPTEGLRAHHLRTGEQLYLPRGDMHWSEAGHRRWLEEAWDALVAPLERARIDRLGDTRAPVGARDTASE